MLVTSENQVKMRIENLSLSFGGVKSLIDVSLDIKDNEILAIIEPNGAGKTCLLNCMSGFYKPQRGEIYYEGKKITRIRPDKAAKLISLHLHVERLFYANSKVVWLDYIALEFEKIKNDLSSLLSRYAAFLSEDVLVELAAR